MISVSNKFVSIMNSNIRPKTDFKITVTGNGNTLEWTAKDITNFTFKRGIDPVGRNLPFLELTWEEIYLGELDVNNEATKYNKVTPYMTVELSIEQSLNFANTWKDIAQMTWGEIYVRGMTWRDVFKKPVTETVKMPKMYLVGKPEIQNQKIKWTARDFLYFLNSYQEIGFQEYREHSNILRYMLLAERANFKNNDDIIKAIQKTQYDLSNSLLSAVYLQVKTLFSGTTKNILKDGVSPLGYFFVMDSNGAYVKQIADCFGQEVVFDIDGKIIKQYPKMTKSKNISSFSFTQYNVKLDEANKYTLSTPDETFENLNSSTIYRYFYKDFGMIEINDSNRDQYIPTTINKNILTTAQQITVIPVSLNSTQIFFNNEKNGEEYIENNPCNFWGLGDIYTNTRKNMLNSWFNENEYTMEFEGLPIFHLEPFDCVNVATNFFENGERVIKKGIILEQTLTFNGGFNQKTIVREV